MFTTTYIIPCNSKKNRVIIEKVIKPVNFLFTGFIL